MAWGFGARRTAVRKLARYERSVDKVLTRPGYEAATSDRRKHEQIR